jgi:hypothetical protein
LVYKHLYYNIPTSTKIITFTLCLLICIVFFISSSSCCRA